MRAAIVSVLTVMSVTSSFAEDPVHHRYGPDDRYAGCLFGDIVPLVRRGYSRQKALSVASHRCQPLSDGLTKRQVQDAADYVNFSIDMMER